MSSMEESWYEKNNMVSEPPMPCDLKVGDIVKFTNDYGAEFGPHKVLGYTTPENVLHGRFIHIDSDAPWFPAKPESLTLWPKMHTFEVTLKGFDGGTDETDHLVKWVQAENEEVVCNWLLNWSLDSIVREILQLGDHADVYDFDDGVDVKLKVLDGIIFSDGDYSKWVEESAGT